MNDTNEATLSRSQGAAEIAVFMVEDSRSVTSALTDLIEEIGGYAVVGVAKTETAATEWLWANAGKWNIATVDLLIENGSGFNLLPRIRKEGPGCTLIVVSEYITEVIGNHCRALGADAVFRKSEYHAIVGYLEQLKQTRYAPPAFGAQLDH